MKKLLLLLIIGLTITSNFAQVQRSFKYQAVVRDNTGNIVSNQSIGIKASMRQDSINGLVVYTETHNPTTNQYGVINLEIGRGTVVFGDFDAVEWGISRHFIQIEMNLTGGPTYQLMGVSELLSVPYALYAEKSGNVSYSDTSATNELQTITVSNDTIYLSNNGGFIKIPDKSCPTGFVAVNGEYCIEINEHVASNWHNAVITCGNADAHLCSLNEWYYACADSSGLSLNNMNNNWEWVSNVVDKYSSDIYLIGNGSCADHSSAFPSKIYSFRCCRNR